MTANTAALLPGALVLLDAESDHLDYSRGERATVVQLEQDRCFTVRIHRTGRHLAFRPDELILVPPSDAGTARTAAVLAFCLLAPLLFLALLKAAEAGLCPLHHNNIAYCTDYQETAR